MHKLLIIVGPTSSGKSELAVKLAKKINGEIISCDSRQIYHGMKSWHRQSGREMAKIKYAYKARPRF